MPQRLKSSTTLCGHAALRLQIEYISIDALKAAPNQVRRHTQTQLRRIARSIHDHGFLVPVVIHGENLIATGNARVAAAKLGGVLEVPVVRAEHLSSEQMRLFAIADNKLAEGVEWIIPALAIEFAEISLAAPNLDQDQSGFSITERDIIFGRARTPERGSCRRHRPRSRQHRHSSRSA